MSPSLGRRFPLWRIITVDGRTLNQIMSSLQSEPFDVTDTARRALETVNFSKTRDLFALCLVSPRDLNSSLNPTLMEIYTRSRRAGLSLCPEETAAYLRLSYIDPPRGERLVVASMPIPINDRSDVVFEIYNTNTDKLTLGTQDGDPFSHWAENTLFVFKLKLRAGNLRKPHMKM